MRYNIKAIESINTGDSVHVTIEATDNDGDVTEEMVIVGLSLPDSSIKTVLDRVAIRGALKKDVVARLEEMAKAPLEVEVPSVEAIAGG